MKKLFIPVVFMSALIATSCKKENNTSGVVSYHLKPMNYTAALMGASKGSNTISSANSLTWTAGNMIISEIDFEAKKEKLKIEYESKKIVNVNLFDVSPALGDVSIPDGTYEEVELKLKVKKTESGVAPLMLSGVYTDASGVNTPVEFSFNEEIEVKVEAENVVITSKDYTGMINLQLSKFLTNVSTSDLSQAIKTNGKIIISSTSNSVLYGKIKSNLDFVADCDFKED